MTLQNDDERQFALVAGRQVTLADQRRATAKVLCSVPTEEVLEVLEALGLVVRVDGKPVPRYRLAKMESHS